MPDYSILIVLSHICNLAKKQIDNKGIDLLLAVLVDSNGSLYGKLPIASKNFSEKYLLYISKMPNV